MKHLYVLVMVAALVLSGCATLQQQDSSGLRIVYGLTLMPSGFDPHLNASAELGIPLRSVYDTLVYRDPNTGQIVAGLATDWESGDDGRSYTFTLREDVKFHDGTDFNAEAVGVNLDRITNPDNGSQKARFMLGSYAGYEIIDEYTIKLNFEAPYAPLLDSLSQVYLGIASPKALAENDNANYQFHQVGTGPFRMVEYVPGDRLVLQRNKDYTWAPSFYYTPENPVQTVEFRFFEDPPTRALALESGDAQIMGEIQPVDAQLLSGNPQIRLYPVPIPGQPLQFMMNLNRFPTDNPAVRQALLYGTNREAIVDAVFQRFSPVAYGPLAAATDYYHPDMGTFYPYDNTQARELLSAVGFTEMNSEGILLAPTNISASESGNGETAVEGVPLKLTVIVPPWGMAPEVAQLLQSQWKTLGVSVEIKQAAGFGALMDAARSGEYNLIAMHSFGRDASLIAQYFKAGQLFNWSGYADFELDNYLDEAAATSDETLRADLYAAAQVRIMEQSVILPIRDYVNLNGASANLDGVAFDAQGWFPLLHNFSLNTEGGN